MARRAEYHPRRELRCRSSAVQDDIVEIPATDPARAAVFYQRVFNFTVEPCPDGTYRVSIGFAAGTAMAMVIRRGFEPDDETMRVYKVAAVEETAARVQRYGGKVIIVTTDANGARISLCRDSEGNRFSIEQAGP